MVERRQVCYLDQDGVIADFVAGALAVHGIPSPYTRPESFGNWDIHTLCGMSANQFWKPINDGGEEFWENLPKTPEADAIVALVEQAFGSNVCVLTAPAFGNGCVPGKRKWLRKNYPQLERSIIFATEKHFIAGPGRTLIDDRDKNIEEWTERGGLGLLLPRPWNKYSALRDDPLSVLHSWFKGGSVC